MVHSQELAVETHQRSHWIDITSGIQKVVARSELKNGIAFISSLHTTAGLTINENADPDVGKDFFWKLNQLVPQDPLFHHSEGNSDSHIKASLMGFSVQVPFRNGKCVLGTWQSIYLCEFDGPRTRKVTVALMGE